jgi:uncharacterized protein (DUF1697 family)
MIKYVAFLRGVNVGGHKLIKMEELRRACASLGFKNVKTYIQSGNVIFETSETSSHLLTARIEKELHRLLGYEVTVFLRTTLEVEEIVKHDPFKGLKFADVKMYVTFLSEELNARPKLPLLSSTKDVEVFQIRNREAFSLSRKKNGRFGFPNNLIEKELGVLATTRTWTTVGKIIMSILPTKPVS